MEFKKFLKNISFILKTKYKNHHPSFQKDLKPFLMA